MQTIYRYRINDSDGVNAVRMPQNAKVLHIGTTKERDENNDIHECIDLWALVDNTVERVTRTFIVVGTGANLDVFDEDTWEYIGSVTKANEYVFHVFEVKA